MPLNGVGLELIDVMWPDRPDLVTEAQARPPGTVVTITVTAADEVLLTMSEIDEWSRS